MKTTIKGTTEQINVQIKELKTKYTYKITKEDSEIDKVIKRRVFTFELELEEK